MDAWKSLRKQVTTVLAAFPAAADSPITIDRPEPRTRFTVFHEYFRDRRKYQGSASFVSAAHDGGGPLPHEYEAARAEALQVADPWYPVALRQGTQLPSKTSTLSKQSLEEWVSPIQDLLHETAKGRDFLLQKEFIRLTREEVRFRDSWGRDLTDVRYSGFLELFLLPAQRPDVQPHHAEMHFSEFSPGLFRDFLVNQGTLACQTHQVRPWVAPSNEFVVLIRGRAVRVVFDHVLRQLSGASAYAGSSTLWPGQPLWQLEATGDPLTVEALPLLYDSPNPALFDEDGVVLGRQVLVREGNVERLLTSPKTAHWLGLPLTGMNRNLAVSPGSADVRALAGVDVLDVHRLRTAEIDEATGDVVAEVELADFHQGGSVTPVFGVTLRGNLHAALTQARFSKDIGRWETYEGPEFIQLPSSVLGGR